MEIGDHTPLVLTFVLAVSTLLWIASVPVGAGSTQNVVAIESSSVEDPTAAFTYSPSTPNPDDDVTLDASGSTDNGSIVSYEWDTDGDGVYGDYDDADDGQTTAVSFDSGGTYTVGLQVTDDQGNTDTVTKQITVDNPAPEPSFSYSPSTPNPDDTITLDASGSSDSDGSIVSYEWDTDGDGVYGDYDDADNGQTTTVSYGSEGTYTVGLKITDNGGKTREVTKQITVDNPAPVANLSVEKRDGLTVTLDAARSSDPDGSIVSYEWDTDGDGVYGDYDDADNGQSATVTFDSKGTYELSVRVTDNGGKTATETITVGVSEPPAGNIDVSPQPVGDDQRVTLIADFTDPDGSIAAYEWLIDGETEATGREVATSFEEVGSVDVTLTVTDETGVETTVNRSIEVRPSPEVTVDASSTNVIDGEQITFNTSSTDVIQYYEWDFDDDGMFESQGESVSHSFPDGGSKTVTVRAKGENGVFGSTTVSIEVAEVKPAVRVDWNPDTPRTGQDVVFNATGIEHSAGDDLSVRWEFGDDGEAKTGETVTHEFDETGRYTVTITVEDENGDEKTIEKIVSVRQSAEFSLTAEQKQIAPGGSVGIVFSASNLVRDTPIDAKIRIEVPSGATVTSVDGGSLVGRSETDFVTIAPGGEETLVVHLQINDPGEYSITGDAVYYVGEQDEDDRRRVAVGPADVTVVEDSTSQASASNTASDSTPIFPIGGLTVVIVSLLVGVYTYNRFE